MEVPNERPDGVLKEALVPEPLILQITARKLDAFDHEFNAITIRSRRSRIRLVIVPSLLEEMAVLYARSLLSPMPS
jgi:hypothetical protein